MSLNGHIPKFQCNEAATLRASIFKASCFLVYCSIADEPDMGGVGGASISTTRSLAGFELAFLCSTDRNSSISSQADGSAEKHQIR